MEPTVVISWSKQDQRWLATAVEPLTIKTNDTTADGRTPMLALDAMLEKAFLLNRPE